ncbi:MAG: GldG family protein [Clostridia bacterium]|nr:GldG family protein [Clostridia bacterium]
MKNKTKRTLSAAAFLAAAITAIFLFNVVIGVAADKIQLRWDLTENKLYALTNETKAVLAGLTEEISLYYFASPGQEKDQIVRALDMYRTATDKLKIIQIDPNTNPMDARRFSDKGVSVQQNTIVLERGERYKAIAASEMYQGYTTQSGETLNNAMFGMEQLVTRAIAYVSAADTKKVCFTTGHNEADYSAVAELLKNENMDAYQVNLKTTEVPENVDSLYIMAPAEDFTEEEILRLDAFLSTGRGVHIAFDANRDVLPRLEKYLQEFWGVTMYHDVVLEGDSSRTINYNTIFIPDIAEHTITAPVTSGNKNTVYMYARSMAVEALEDVSSTVLAATTSAGSSFHGSDSSVKEPIREGKLPVSAALERVSKEGEKRGRMVVSGSYHMYDTTLLAEASLANSTLLYGTANYIHYDEDSPLSISPKTLLMRVLAISDGMATFYIVIVCVLPSLIFFAAGVWTWRRRRHL